MAEIITDLDNEAYHNDPAIGSSALKLMDTSPAHCYAKYFDPEREREESTPAQKLGTATHMAVFEPELFSKTYVVVPEGVDRRSNAGKALFAEIEDRGQQVLKPDQYKYISGMVKSLHSHKVLRLLLSLPHKFEASMFWVDDETGIKCKFRPDLFVEPCSKFPNGLIADLKTTTDASPIGFARQAWNNKMYIQSAFYPDGFRRVFNTQEPPMFLWLAAETDAPFARQFYAASGDIQEYGRSEYRRLLNLAAECFETGVWTGYPESVTELEFPEYAMRKIFDNQSDEIVEIAYAK